MSEDVPLKLYPAWRQVQADLMNAGLQDGRVITDAYLCESFGLSPPTTAEDAEKFRALFNFQAGQLCDGLLREHRILLRRVTNIGYVVVPPQDQTKVSMDSGASEMLRAFERASLRVRYVRTESLDDSQLKENADAAAKLGALGSMMRKRLKGPNE